MSVSVGVAPRRRARGASRRAAAQPDDAPAVAHRERRRRSTSAACSCSPTSRKRRSRRAPAPSCRAARCGSPASVTLRRAPPRAGDRRVLRALSADALRRRALRSRRRLVDEGFDARGAHRRHRQPEPRRAQDRRDAARLLRGARPISRATASRARRRISRAHACLTYEYAPQRNVWHVPRPRGARAQRARSRVPCTRTTGSFLEALAVAGIGIAYEPDFIVGPDVRAGRLVPILRDVRAAGRRHPRRVPEPAPPVGEGARVHRFPRATVHRRRMGARRAGERGEGEIQAMMVDSPCLLRRESA